MTEKANNPSIRFKGFTDAWELRELGTECKITMGQSPNGEHYTTNPNDFILVQGNADMQNGWVFPRVYTTQVTRMAEEGDLIFSVRAPVGEVGKTAYKVVIGRGVAAIKGKEFIFQSLKRMQKYGYWTKISAGSTFESVNADALKTAIIAVPSDSEQEQTGSFLSKLDTLITLHQRKYDKLVNVKKSLLEKMFPSDDENVPKIRFKGFTDAWQQRKFSNLYHKVSEKNNLTYGKEDIISVANMYFKEDTCITDNEYLRTYNIFLLGDIAFEGNKSKDFKHGRFVENTIGNGIVSHVFDVFRPIMEKYDLSFWKYAINNERLMGNILIRSTKASTMMTNLVADDFLNEYFLVPKYAEQKAIGQALSVIDNLITLHQRKLEKLKNIKKALLDKMFV